MPTIEAKKMLAVAAEACDAKKAEDIRILQLDPSESGLADYFLICSGNSDRQNSAIADEVDIQIKRQFGQYPRSVEGRRQGEWILMDYVDFIVHIFTTEKRAFYSLERLRKTATSVTTAELNSQLKPKRAAAKNKTIAKKAGGGRAAAKNSGTPMGKVAAKKSAKRNSV